MVRNKKILKMGLIDVPTVIDDKVGILKLNAMSIKIDTLTEEQYNYIHGYEESTKKE